LSARSRQAEVSQAVLLVGGLGTRLRPLTYTRPKALVPLLNRPLISYELELLARHGVRDVIMAISYRADQLRAGLGDGERWGVSLRYVEEPEPLGTAGGIKNVQSLIEGPFFALNGDLVMDADLGELARAHLQAGAMLTLCLRPVEDISAFGLIQRDPEGWVTAFLEKVERDETGQNTVNSGVYVMSPEILEHIPAGREYSNEHQLFPGLLEAGERVYGHVPAAWGYWNDIGRLDAYLEANRSLLEGALPGVGRGRAESAALAAGAQIREPCLLDAGARVASSAVVGPWVTLGAAAAVGEGARVSDTILWPRASVGAGARVKSSVIGEAASVPDHAVVQGKAIAD
jgi:NDP-sugar pyrophosphorylase family protein